MILLNICVLDFKFASKPGKHLRRLEDQDFSCCMKTVSWRIHHCESLFGALFQESIYSVKDVGIDTLS